LSESGCVSYMKVKELFEKKHIEVLVTLYKNPSISLRELRRRLKGSFSTFVSCLRELEEWGLVERPRRRGIRLTRKGEEVVRALARIDELLRTEEERRTLTITAVHERELERALKRLGLLKKVKRGEMKCPFCGRILTIDTIGAIAPLDGVKLICDNPKCIYRAVLGTKIN